MPTAAFLVNRPPHSAIAMQSPYKLLRGMQPEFRLLRVMGARTLVYVETDPQKLELNAVEGRLVGYSNNTGHALSELRGLNLCTKMTLPDISHETHGADSAVEYVYAVTNVQNCYASESAKLIPNTFKRAKTVPAKAKWKAP